MARHMAADDQEMFRAVVEVTYRDTAPEGPEDRSGTPVEPRAFTNVLGPYRTKGAAKAAIKRADREAQWYKRYYDEATVTGRIEKATTVWEPVDG